MTEWIETTAGDTGGHPGLIDAIFSRSIDGVVVSGVFTEPECVAAVNRLERSRGLGVAAMFGPMLGLPLADLATRVPDPTSRDVYLDDAARTEQALAEAFGFVPSSRVAATIEPMASGRRVGVPMEGTRQYASGNVRWFEPGLGGLPAHVDNEFNSYHDGTLAYLQTLAETNGHLSWFVVLQQPGEGGALAVFDEIYGEHEPAMSEWTDRGRVDGDFDRLSVRRLYPEAGSMVIFGGGWRWHHVEPVRMLPARVTYGGFAAAAHNGQQLYLWF